MFIKFAPDMRVVSEEVQGNITVKEDTQYNQINADHLCVESNVKVRVYGSVKNLTIKEGSDVTIHGCITGQIKNERGTLTIYDC